MRKRFEGDQKVALNNLTKSCSAGHEPRERDLPTIRPPVATGPSSASPSNLGRRRCWRLRRRRYRQHHEAFSRFSNDVSCPSQELERTRQCRLLRYLPGSQYTENSSMIKFCRGLKEGDAPQRWGLASGTSGILTSRYQEQSQSRSLFQFLSAAARW